MGRVSSFLPLSFCRVVSSIESNIVLLAVGCSQAPLEAGRLGLSSAGLGLGLLLGVADLQRPLHVLVRRLVFA